MCLGAYSHTGLNPLGGKLYSQQFGALIGGQGAKRCLPRSLPFSQIQRYSSWDWHGVLLQETQFWPQCVFRFPFSFSWVCVLYSNLAFPSGPLTANAMVLVGTQASHTLAGEWREWTLGSARSVKLPLLVCTSLSACLHWYLSSTIRSENRIRYCLAWYAFILTYKALIIECTSLSEMAPF